jgi:hypothetical protein
LAERRLLLEARWIPMWWQPHANPRVRIPIEKGERERVIDRRSMQRRLLSLRFGDGEVVVHPAAVIRWLRLPQQHAPVAPAASRGGSRLLAVKREQARRAVTQVYPQGVPDQATVANLVLVGAITEHLRADGIITRSYLISRDTILRAAGRKK